LFSIPILSLSIFVTKRSSHTVIILSPSFVFNSFHPSKSSSAIPSSIDIIGYFAHRSWYKFTNSLADKVFPSPDNSYFPSLKNSEEATSSANLIFHVYPAFSIASTITCKASSLLHRFGAKPHSSPTEVARPFAFKIAFKLWKISVHRLNHSLKFGAETGTIINS